MITTTLNRIRAHENNTAVRNQLFQPYYFESGHLLIALGKTRPDDEQLPFSKIVEVRGLDYAVWCCRVEPQYVREWVLFSIWCVRRVEHLIGGALSPGLLDVAQRHARGEATNEELEVARKKAGADREVAEKTIEAVLYAADAVTLAAQGDPRAADEVLSAARAARVALPTELVAQTAEFLRIVNETEART